MGTRHGYSRDMRRIERLINLIAALLDTTRALTAEQIRSRIAGYDQESFEAFRRAFERDKEALRAMGIPLELSKSDPFVDQEDAYSIPKARYYLPQLDFDPDEVAALKIAAEILLGAGEHASAALLKLSIDSPSAPTPAPRIVWGANLAAEQPLLGRMYAALIERHPVTFRYHTAAGESSLRTVRPYRLLHRNGHWYVVGFDPDRSAIRAFRVSRIDAVIDVGTDDYEIPEDFDAGAHLGEAWAIGDEPHTATVRFDQTMRWWAEQNMPDCVVREAPDGALELELPVGNEDALISWAIGFGSAVEIIKPETARARLVEHIRPLLEAAP